MNRLLLVLVSIAFIHNANCQSFDERAQVVIDHIADYYPQSNNGKNPPGYKGDLSDFGKYNYPKIIAYLHKYGTENTPQADTANARLKKYAKLPTFHFNLVGLPRILYLFPEAHGVKNNEVQFLKRVWERNDSYNAWTSEGTENHINMSRTSGYLYAQLAHEKYPETFTDASNKLDRMKDWIMYFSKRIYEVGTGEFNSTTYGAFNLIGWLNLYDFAHDEEVKQAARAVLDYYACEIAVHYVQALTGGADMRGNGKIESFDGATAYYGWLWFGDSPRPVSASTLSRDNDVIQAIHGATSSYRVPELAVKLAQGQMQVPSMHYNSKPNYLLSTPSFIKETLYNDKNYSLGAGYIPYDGWGSGNYQIVSWKLLSKVEPGKDKTVQYLSGIGMQNANSKYFQYGNHRSPFDQLAHHKNVLIQLTKVPENVANIKSAMKQHYQAWQKAWLEDVKKRFPNDTYKHNHNPIHFQDLDISENSSYVVMADQGEWKSEINSEILFLALENTYVAIQSIDGSAPSKLAKVENGKMYFSKVSASKGKVCGFIIEVANRDNYDDFKAFQSDIIRNTSIEQSDLDPNRISYKSATGDKIQVAYQENGYFEAPLYDWGYGVETQQLYLTSPPFAQPNWPRKTGSGRLAKWSVNGTVAETSLNAIWPVYSGPNFTLDESILTLTNNDGQCYTVDYRGAVPVFLDECVRGQ